MEAMNRRPLLQRCWIVACAFCLLAAPGYAQDDSNCSGVANERAERLLEDVLSEEGWKSRLESYNIDVSSVEELRVMTNEQDPEACSKIGRDVEEDSKYDFYLYTAEPYYFGVGFPRRVDGEWTTPNGIIIIYDEEANAVAGSSI